MEISRHSLYTAAMAYEVTATRRRPKIFSELVGQDFVVSTIKSSIESGRIAQAYLFSGPRGCGKTSAARILARSLNCDKGPTTSPCGVCASCVEITRGASLDVLEIDGASNTGVNDVRQIKDEVLFPPNSGRYKIYIIDEVHMLSNAAFNALLKTIEEPPPYIVFIFATTEIHKVPATIKSRCQQFQFRLISLETIKETLAITCQEMNLEAEDEALFWIAKEATGSLRDAYTLFDQVAAFSEGHISAESIRQKLGLIGLDAINALVESCSLKNPATAFSELDNILQSGVAVEQLVVDLVEYFRNLLLIKSGVTNDFILGYPASRYSQAALNCFNSEQIEEALSLLLKLYRDLRYSVSQRFDLEFVLSRLCWLKLWVSPLELRDSVNKLKRFIKNSPTLQNSKTETYATAMEDPPEKLNTKEETTQKVDLVLADDLPALKQAAIAQLQKNNLVLASGLENSGLWSLDDKTIVIPVFDHLCAELLQKGQAVLIACFLNLTGTRFFIEIVETEKPALPNDQVPVETETPSAVETVRRLFQGTIVQN